MPLRKYGTIIALYVMPWKPFVPYGFIMCQDLAIGVLRWCLRPYQAQDDLDYWTVAVVDFTMKNGGDVHHRVAESCCDLQCEHFGLD